MVAMILPIVSNGYGNNYAANYTSAAEEKTLYRIMPLGDSITAGYCPGSDYQFGGYRMYLANMLEENGFSEKFDFVGKWNTGQGYDMGNNGTNGVMISNDDWGDSIKTDIVKNGILDTYQPDMILLQIGTNDILGQDEKIELREVSKINERLVNLIDTMMTYVKEDGIIFLASIPYMESSKYEKYNNNVKDYNLFIRQLVKTRQLRNQNIFFVDINNAVSEGQYVDGVHPNQEGYEQMGTLWYETIMSYLYDREAFLAKQEELLYIPEATIKPTVEPTVKPTVPPAKKTKDTAFRKGKKYIVHGLTYKVTKTGKNNAVQVVKASASIKNKKSIKVPAKVNVKGVSCQVTSIGKNVFKNAKAKKIIIGKNVIDIQKGAFVNCRKLKQIQFQGKKWKRVASGVGKKTAGVKFVVPKGKKKAYKTLIKKGGFKIKAVMCSR